MKTKRIKLNKNGTRKQKHTFSEKELGLICKGKASSLEKFEEKFEKGLNKNLLIENNSIQR